LSYARAFHRRLLRAGKRCRKKNAGKPACEPSQEGSPRVR
jgi:hypothetical protein